MGFRRGEDVVAEVLVGQPTEDLENVCTFKNFVEIHRTPIRKATSIAIPIVPIEIYRKSAIVLADISLISPLSISGCSRSLKLAQALQTLKQHKRQEATTAR